MIGPISTEKRKSGKKGLLFSSLGLNGFVAILIMNLMSPAPVSAASFTGLGDLSGGGIALEAPVFSSDLSRAIGLTLASATFADSFGERTSLMRTDIFGKHGNSRNTESTTSLTPVPSMIWPILASGLLTLLGVEPRKKSRH